MISHDLKITLAILMGGQGRRLGGPKEDMVNAAGVKLLQEQIDRVEDGFRELFLLTGNKPPPAFRAPGCATRCLNDPANHLGQGPMAGLLAGLTACMTEWLAVLPVDCPFFPLDAFPSALAAGATPVLGFLDQNAQPQWLPGLYHRSLEASLRQALGRGELRFGSWAKSLQPTFLPWSHPTVNAKRAFTNLNSPRQAALAGYRQGP